MTFDLIEAAVFFAAQARLFVLLWRWRRRLAAPWQKAASWALVSLLVLLAFGYACSYSEFVALFHLPGTAASVAGAITVSYLLCSSAGVILHTVFQPIQKTLGGETDAGRRRLLGAARNVLAAAPVVSLAYGALVQRTNFQVREVDVPLAGLPDDLAGLRLLLLSDIHLSVFLSEGELSRVIDATRELHPHIAFATGDFISTFGDPLEACIRQLARVRADAGMFGCLGNHEHYARVEAATCQLAGRVGIPILRSESRQLRFGKTVLNIAGVDYQPFYRRKEYLLGADRLVYPGAVNLLLSHNPDVFPVAAHQGYNLMLSGHTHGGQVTVEILDHSINPARFFTPYVRGLYRSGPSAAYVTRGIGTIGIPARLGSLPEISLLRLRKA